MVVVQCAIKWALYFYKYILMSLLSQLSEMMNHFEGHVCAHDVCIRDTNRYLLRPVHIRMNVFLLVGPKD